MFITQQPQLPLGKPLWTHLFVQGERAEFTVLIFPGGVFPGHYRARAIAVDGHSEDGLWRAQERQ